MQLSTSEQITPATPESTAAGNDGSHVIKEVLRQVGRPEGLMRIEAKQTWGNNYRVNLYCTQKSDHPVKTVAITDSFFVTMGEQGLVSDPPLTRKYG